MFNNKAELLLKQAKYLLLKLNCKYRMPCQSPHQQFRVMSARGRMTARIERRQAAADKELLTNLFSGESPETVAQFQ